MKGPSQEAKKQKKKSDPKSRKISKKKTSPREKTEKNPESTPKGKTDFTGTSKPSLRGEIREKGKNLIKPREGAYAKRGSRSSMGGHWPGWGWVGGPTNKVRGVGQRGQGGSIQK